MSVSHTTNSYMNTLGHISSLKSYGLPDVYTGSNPNPNSVNGTSGHIGSLTVDTISGTSGHIGSVTADTVSGYTGIFSSLKVDTISGTSGHIGSVTADTISGYTGIFSSVTADTVNGTNGNIGSLKVYNVGGANGNIGSLTVKNLILESTPSIFTFTEDNGIIIDLGNLSTINIQTVTLPSKINYVNYKNGINNGMYIIKFVLSSYTFSLGNYSPNVFNNTFTTFTTPYVLVNVNVFLDETNTLQYFSSATPYSSY